MGERGLGIVGRDWELSYTKENYNQKEGHDRIKGLVTVNDCGGYNGLDLRINVGQGQGQLTFKELEVCRLDLTSTLRVGMDF